MGIKKYKTMDPITNILFEIFNGITPNGDGFNDYFQIDGIDQFSNNNVKIFNRWGEVLFETTDPSSGWDGMHPNGKEAIQGVYTWTVFAKGQNDKLIEKRGHLSLLR